MRGCGVSEGEDPVDVGADAAVLDEGPDIPPDARDYRCLGLITPRPEGARPHRQALAQELLEVDLGDGAALGADDDEVTLRREGTEVRGEVRATDDVEHDVE